MDGQSSVPKTPTAAQVLSDRRRLASLEATNLMDGPHEEVFDRAVRLATQLTGRPVGLLSLVDGTRQFFKAQIGLSEPTATLRETPLSHSFCQHVVTEDQPFIVTDAREDIRVRDNLAVPDLDVIAYLGVPVHGPDGQTLGAFCVIDGAPHEWSASDLKVLEDLSAMIEAELKLRETVAQRDLLIGEMDHRLKNVFTLVAGMIRQSARGAKDAEDLAEQITGRLQALNAAHSLILPGTSSTGGDVSLTKLCGTLLAPYPATQRKISGSDIQLGPKAAVAISLSLHELATNAAKYGGFADGKGHVDVAWSEKNDGLSLIWQEAVPGVTAADMQETGFGSRLLRMNIEGQLQGRFDRTMTPQGVQVQIYVPRGALGD